MSEEENAAKNELDQSIDDELNAGSATAQTDETQTTEEETPAEADTSNDGSDYVEVDEDSKYQKRINKITAEKHQYKREAEGLRQQLEQVTAKPSNDDQVNEAPKLEDFDEEKFGYDSEKRLAAYTEALTDFKAKQIVDSRFEENATQAQQQAEQARQAQIQQEFNSKEAAYIEANPSYLDDMVNLPRYSPEVVTLLNQQGPKLVHYLAKNPDIANQVANSNIGQAAMTLGSLSEVINQTKPNENKGSKAPEPPKTLSGNGAVTKDIGEMSMEEIMAL